MNKKFIVICSIVLLILLITVPGFFMFFNSKKILTFKEDKEISLNNPMQGFYTQVDTADANRLSEIKSSGTTLILLACNLNGYQDKSLDENKLNEIKQALSLAADLKMDIIFRAAYGFIEGFETIEPDSPDTVYEHISQISEVISPFSDIILCIQAGMIGPWGEWHSSSLLEDLSEDLQVSIRCSVVDAWVKGIPDENVIIQLRTPEFIRLVQDYGIPIKRLGFHNDALLSDVTDMGTYIGDNNAREGELEWVNVTLSHSPFGGEMPQLSGFTFPKNAVDEFRKLHLTYLNSTYNIEVLDEWKEKAYQNQSTYDYIKNHMGSRLHVSSVSATENPSENSKAKIEITVNNTGFALPHPDLNFKIYTTSSTQQCNEPDSVKYDAVTNSYKITAYIPIEGDLLSLGLWAGFGENSENGRTFYLANRNNDEKIDIFYFMKYEKSNKRWKLKSF